MGTSADTPRFAAEAVARWWGRYGCHRYRQAGAILLLADGGGSNGYRPRLWKSSLHELLADRYGLVVTVCHYPTGASKWNPVEHRLFGPISINWAGVPLRSPELLLGLLRGDDDADADGAASHGGVVGASVSARGESTGGGDAGLAHPPACGMPRWNYTITPRGREHWN